MGTTLLGVTEILYYLNLLNQDCVLKDMILTQTRDTVFIQ